MANNIGIFPGTFDPLHEGHLAFASEAAKILNLDNIVLIPENKPRNKPRASPIIKRLAQIKTALEDRPFSIVQLDSDRFTVNETLPELITLFSESEITLLLGSDVAVNLPRWQNVEELVQLCGIAVGMRQNDDPEAVKKLSSQ